MRVLLTSNYAPPHGGVANVVYFLSKYLSINKHSVSIASSENGFSELSKYGCAVRKIQCFRVLNDVIPTPFGILQLARTVAKTEVAFIHTPYFVISNITAVLAFVFRKKIVCMFHGRIYLKWRNKLHLPFINMLTQKWLFLNTGDSFFVKEHVHNIKPYCFVSNGIDLDTFKPKSLKKHTKKFIFVGRLEKEKGIEELILAIKHFPKIHFGIIGDGPYKKVLKKLTNVSCFGYRSHKDTLKIMNNYDCLILPSHSEAFPIVILEARANGLKIISTNFNENAKKMVAGAGIIIEKENADELKSAIKNINTVSGFKKINKNYDWKKIIKKFEKELTSVNLKI